MNTIKNRIKKLLDRMESENLDGLFILKTANVNYISGFTNEDSYVLITKEGYYFITDGRYTEQAEEECPDFEVIRWGKPTGTIADTVEELAIKNNLKRIGFEKDCMTYGMYEQFSKTITQAELFPVSGLVEDLRYTKDKDEIDNIKIAAAIADAAFSKIIEFIKPGMKESDVALQLEYYMRKAGADGIAFDTILISGRKTSLPHGIPSEKIIENGDFITIDFGALYKGYRSDMTRTIAVGEISEKQLEIYELVKKAEEEGINCIKSGVSSKLPDDKVREVLKDYIEYYYPGLGHGVGRELHEQPFLGSRGDRVIEKNCVITVEPGIYIPGWGGVRIEDTLVVTEDGYEILTKSPKELIILK